MSTCYANGRYKTELQAFIDGWVEARDYKFLWSIWLDGFEVTERMPIDVRPAKREKVELHLGVAEGNYRCEYRLFESSGEPFVTQDMGEVRITDGSTNVILPFILIPQTV